MKKTLREYQIDDDIKMKELQRKVKRKLSLISNMYVDPEQLKAFVNNNYDLLLTDSDSVLPKILLQNYLDFIKKDIVIESANKTLREADEFLNQLKKIK